MLWFYSHNSQKSKSLWSWEHQIWTPSLVKILLFSQHNTLLNIEHWWIKSHLHFYAHLWRTMLKSKINQILKSTKQVESFNCRATEKLKDYFKLKSSHKYLLMKTFKLIIFIQWMFYLICIYSPTAFHLRHQTKGQMSLNNQINALDPCQPLHTITVR